MDLVQSFFNSLKALMPETAVPKVLGLEAALLTGTLTQVADYRVDSQKDLYILSVAGYVRFGDWSNESALATVLGTNVAPKDRYLVKAANCVFDLKNNDRDESLFTGNSSTPIKTIDPALGGAPLDFTKSPLVIPGGNTLRATFALKDSTSAIIGASTVYGLQIRGLLLPRK